MTERRPIFNPIKLNSQPVPRRGWEVVFQKECPHSIPEEAPDAMICRTESEYRLLGRMYDKQVIQQLDTSGTPSFLGTQQSYLNMLCQRGLTEPIIRQRNRYQLTSLGIRVYELNYWLNQYRRQKKSGKKLDIAHAIFTGQDGNDWTNPKPYSEPMARPHKAIVDDALPEGVYPALDK